MKECRCGVKERQVSSAIREETEDGDLVLALDSVMQTPRVARPSRVDRQTKR